MAQQNSLSQIPLIGSARPAPVAGRAIVASPALAWPAARAPVAAALACSARSPGLVAERPRRLDGPYVGRAEQQHRLDIEQRGDKGCLPPAEIRKRNLRMRHRHAASVGGALTVAHEVDQRLCPLVGPLRSIVISR